MKEEEAREFTQLCRETKDFLGKAFDIKNNPLGYFNFRGESKEEEEETK